MTAAVIEINDVGLSCVYNERQVISPGYALITNEGIITGEPALQRSYLEPQCAFNHFWRQLSLSPLPFVNKFARHHADLAYAHLKQLHAETGSPEKVIFAVPGSFTDDQLSILLGLGNALPFDVVGMVDSAVVACAGEQQALLYIDVHLHQTVLTKLSSAAVMKRLAVEVMAGFGLKACHAVWAHYVAEQYIKQYRYDPLHTAAGEQQLHNKLPVWIKQLSQQTELAIELDTVQGPLRLSINRTEMQGASKVYEQALRKAIEALTSDQTLPVYSYRIGQLLGHHFLPQVGRLEKVAFMGNGLTANCLANQEVICHHNGEVHFVTELPLSTQAVVTNGPSSIKRPSQRCVPSHVLIEGVAYPVLDQLALEITPLGFNCVDNSSVSKDCLLFTRIPDGVAVESRTEKEIITQAQLACLQSGDTLSVNGFELQLIEVC